MFECGVPQQAYMFTPACNTPWKRLQGSSLLHEGPEFWIAFRLLFNKTLASDVNTGLENFKL